MDSLFYARSGTTALIDRHRRWVVDVTTEFVRWILPQPANAAITCLLRQRREVDRGDDRLDALLRRATAVAA